MRGRGLWSALLLALLLAACGGQGGVTMEPDLHIEDAWAPPVQVRSGSAEAEADHAGHASHAGHADGSNGAVYLTLRNTRREDDRLIGVESPVAQRAEIHRSQVEDGITRMRRVESVPVGPGETIEFRPGGLHLMLIHLTRSLLPGDRFPVRLHFEREGWREVEAEVRAP